MFLLWEIVDQVAQGPPIEELDQDCSIDECRHNEDGRCANGLDECRTIEYR